MTTDNSVEAWVLMALINKDLDDFDYKNALLLSERLYAMDKKSEDYRLLYAKCLYLVHDYNGSHDVLQDTHSIPCLNLFARSCLELGNQEPLTEKKNLIWREGTKAVNEALTLLKQEESKTHCWGDDLASVSVRSYIPSKASLCHLQGELYTKLENIRASADYLWASLDESPFKLSAYTQLCDIAPDVPNFDTAIMPHDIFKNFSVDTTSLACSNQRCYPKPPSPNVSGIDPPHTHQPLPLHKVGPYMPSLRGDYIDVPLDLLRSLVYHSSQLSSHVLDDEQPLRGAIEERKIQQIESIQADIERMKAEEAYKNKHGLHKKPPVETPQTLQVELAEETEIDLYDILQQSPTGDAPRLEILMSDDQEDVTIKDRLRPSKKRQRRSSQDFVARKQTHYEGSNKEPSLDGYFIPSTRSSTPTDRAEDEIIINAMNKVIGVLCVLAQGYMYQSFYRCRETALELQKLDDRQYDTAWVLCMVGKAYYDAGEHQTARVFYRRAFIIAPWFCDGVPTYSTCLWYLEKEQELNLLAYKMKDNQSHQYEAFIAAGNWSKCVKGSNEASKWFQKAVQIDPSRSYGHALLGYEDWEKDNCLGAKIHFANCMVANKRSYLGWYGMAKAYQGMEQYAEAKSLLAEAVRLHPRHPLLLFTTAEVLFALEEYEEAYDYINQSLQLQSSVASRKLKEKIYAELNRASPNNHSFLMDI